MKCECIIDKKWGPIKIESRCSMDAKYLVEYKLSKSGNIIERKYCTKHFNKLKRDISRDIHASDLVSVEPINHLKQ